jgi:hypothetical protein
LIKKLIRGRIARPERIILLFCAVQRSKSSLFGERKGSDTYGLHWTEHDESASTEATTDVVVEDEVHPDFI